MILPISEPSISNNGVPAVNSAVSMVDFNPSIAPLKPLVCAPATSCAAPAWVTLSFIVSKAVVPSISTTLAARIASDPNMVLSAAVCCSWLILPNRALN